MRFNFVGKSVKRKEDYALLTGQGKYIADLKREGMLHAAFLRSPYGHARIISIDTREALAMPGVVGVWTAADLDGLGEIQPLAMLPEAIHEEVQLKRKDWTQPALAKGKVRYAGEPVAVVLADNRYRAEDALEAIKVEYEVLEANTSIEKALDPKSPKLFDHWPDNIQATFEVEKNDWKNAFEEADLVLERTYIMGRSTGVPMECRGVLAEFDETKNQLVVWSSTQVPHFVKNNLVQAFNCSKDEIRVVAPRVGGGFGIKGNVYPEELVVPYLSRKLKRPVKWIEDRMEHMQAASHARDQVHHIRAAFMKDGTLLAIDDHFYVDCGAYNLWETCVSFNTAAHLMGPYRCPAYHCKGHAVITNKSPAAPYRGAGRPEAVFTFERLLDEAAQMLSMDRMALRKKLLITAEEMPYDAGIYYRDGRPVVYDSGDFQTSFNKLLEAVDYQNFLTKQQEEREKGIYLGLGIAGFIEGTGIGPYEGANVRLAEDGSIVVATGAASQGQGHETSFSQICAEVFDIDVDQIVIKEGDTALIERGIGTFASRSAVVAGSAIYEASLQLKSKLLQFVSTHFHLKQDGLFYEKGAVYSHEDPFFKQSLAEIANLALSEGLLDQLQVVHYFSPETVTYTSGFHAAMVKVDIDTGRVDLLDYYVVHDAGVEINPMIVEGQLYGGLLQGIGGALLEELVYSEKGELVSATLKEYKLPNIYNMPKITLIKEEYPSTRNPLGLKGTGEGGAICPQAAIANAVADALLPFNVKVNQLPLTPQIVHGLISQKREHTGKVEPVYR